MEAVDSTTVSRFRKSLGDNLLIRKDSWRTYSDLALQNGLQVESRVPPPAEVKNWLPFVHMAMANVKRLLYGTFHDVSSRKLQKYLDEFVYRYNRRFWESQLPDRLLRVCTHHSPILASILYNEEKLL